MIRRKIDGSPRPHNGKRGSVRIPFTLRGIAGQADISITVNKDPDAVGYSLLFDSSLDFSWRHGS
jgi:hypothetical protein